MRFFDNINTYEALQEEQASIAAATALAGQLYGYDNKTEANLSENQWLRQYKFADKDGRLIDECGHLVDTEGRLINEDGRFVNKNGELTDNQGRSVDSDGNFVVKTKPFLDDDTGEPIVTKIKAKQKRKSKKD